MQKNKVTLAQVGSTIQGKFDPVTIDGYSPDNDRALIVHKDPTKQGWNIAHENGYAIIKGIRTRKIALMAAEELGWLADWKNINLDNAIHWYNANREAMLEIKAKALS